MIWTIALTAEITRRWAAGESGGVIAAAMGITRNAVIGRVHRLKLLKRIVKTRSRPPGRPRNRQPRLYAANRPRQPRVAAMPDMPIAGPVSLAVTIMDLQPRQCRFITSDAPTALFCAHATYDGSSWCCFHHRIVFAPAEPLSRERVAIQSPWGMVA